MNLNKQVITIDNHKTSVASHVCHYQLLIYISRLSSSFRDRDYVFGNRNWDSPDDSPILIMCLHLARCTHAKMAYVDTSHPQQ